MIKVISYCGEKGSVDILKKNKGGLCVSSYR